MFSNLAAARSTSLSRRRWRYAFDGDWVAMLAGRRGVLGRASNYGLAYFDAPHASIRAASDRLKVAVLSGGAASLSGARVVRSLAVRLSTNLAIP